MFGGMLKLGLLLVPAVLFAAGDELLSNGSFEQDGTCANEAGLRARGFDLGSDGQAFRWAAGWTINPAVTPAKVRVVEAADAPDGGRCLSVVSPGSTHIYSGGGEAGKRYAWEVWARGEPLEHDGRRVEASLSVVMYHYGVLDELTGREGFLSSWEWKKLLPGRSWTRYRGVLTTRNPDANRFTFALGFAGSVVVDAVSLRLLSEDGPEPPPARTFYLSFEKGPDAVTPVGDGTATVVGELEFAEGKEGRGLVCSAGGHLEFAAPGNFDQNEGSLAFWLRPLASADDGRAHCLVEVPVPPHDFLDSGFVISKGFTDQVAPGLFYFVNGPPWAAVSLGAETVWERDQWQHLLFAWSQASGRLAVYRNGILMAEYRSAFTLRPVAAGRRLIIGARAGGVTKPPGQEWDRNMGNKARDLPATGGYPAEAVIDELQIFARMVSGEEAWRLAGGSGPVPVSAETKLDPAPVVSLPHDLVTPHVPFAKPLVGGPVKALFLIPQSLARDVVELWQRMDITFDAFLLGPHHRNPFGANDHARKYHDGLSDGERARTLLGQLAAGPDVVVLAGADLSKATQDVRARLLDLVRAGTGLVMTSRGIRDGPFTAREDAEGRATICSGIPWSGLPELFADSATPRSDVPGLVVRAYTCGKGRVVAIRFREQPVTPVGNLNVEAALTPCLFGIPYTREWDSRYGRYLALVGRALHWASGRVRPWRVELPDDGLRLERDDMPQDGLLRLDVSASKPGRATLAVAVRDELGRVEQEKELPVVIDTPGGRKTVRLECPVLKTGMHYLDVQLLLDGVASDWASAAFVLTGPERIREVELRRDSVERDTPVHGRVVFYGVVQAAAELTVRAVDTLGRVHASLSRHVAPGTGAVPFALVLDDPATLASYVEAVLEREGQVVSEAAAVVFVPRRDLVNPDTNEFPSVGWLGFGPVTGPGMVYARQVREAGFDVGLRWPVDMALRNCAMWDFTPVVYSTRLLMQSTPEGWTKPPPDVEDGSFANPAVREFEWRRIEKRLGDARTYGPLFYSLGDECHYYGEMGYSPWGLKAYRQHLAEKYGTIARLNREWRAEYASLDHVPRLTPSEAREQRHVPAMIEHRAALEKAWRGMFVYLRRRILEYDPQAEVGAEGSMTADLARMLQAMDVWAPYASPRTDVLMRSLARPGQIRGHWHGHYCGSDQRDAAGLTRLWGQLFRGFANASFYFATGVSSCSEGMLMPDGSYTAFFRTQQSDLDLIRNGVGQLLRASTPWRCGAMIHWSQASRLGLEAAGELGTPQATDGVLIQAFRRLPAVGGHWRYVTTEQLPREATGRLIILPVSQCLSQSEADALQRFTETGGVLLGIGPVGTRNEFGRELPESRLGSLFGVTMHAPATAAVVKQGGVTFDCRDRKTSLKWVRNRVNRSLSVTDGVVLAELAGTPLVVRKQVGRGEALLLNLDLARCDRQAIEHFVACVVDAAGCVAPVQFTPPPGPGDRWGMLTNGDLSLLGVVLDHRAGQWNGGRITLRTPQHVVNVRTGESLGPCREIPVEGRSDTQSAALFALQAAPIGELIVRCPRVAVAGQPIAFEAAVASGQGVSAEGRVVRLRVSGPGGVPRRHYQRMVYLDSEGLGRTSVTFALNDPVGPWSVEAYDVAAGTARSATLQLVDGAGAE